MHARELLELAALASIYGPAIAGGNQRLDETNLERYWTASKCRLDRWGHALKQHAARPQPATLSIRTTPTVEIRAVVEEILTSEALTRVWCAVLCAHDRIQGAPHAEPIGRSVLVGHLEARHRTLRLLAHGPGISAGDALQLNRLRRRTERWTDLLIGYLGSSFDVTSLAPNPTRASEFAAELHDQATWQRQGQAWPVALASIRCAFAELAPRRTGNDDLNADIVQSIVGSFQPELFDSTGLFRSLWLLRLGSTSNDAQVMIDEWFAEQRPPRQHRAGDAPPDFQRRKRY